MDVLITASSKIETTNYRVNSVPHFSADHPCHHRGEILCGSFFSFSPFSFPSLFSFSLPSFHYEQHQVVIITNSPISLINEGLPSTKSRLDMDQEQSSCGELNIFTMYIFVYLYSAQLVVSMITLCQVCLVSWALSIVLTSPLLAIANYHVSRLVF